MNTDCFLTRVWDKEEKRMIYVGDLVNKEPNLKTCCYEFLGVNQNYIICQLEFHDIELILFGKRFIPMLCAGRKSCDGKLAYDGDIVSPAPGSEIFMNKDCVNWLGRIEIFKNDEYLMAWLIEGIAAWPIEKCIIRGNIYENPELLENE